MKPSEIESAVKSLAKTYKPAEPDAPDLFEGQTAEAPVEAEEDLTAEAQN